MFIMFISLSLIGVVCNECPKFCSVCLANTLICENGGYTEFPSKFQIGTENITLIGHIFTSNTLASVNMTGILKLTLRYLAIRACSIQDLSRNTFSGFKDLEILDLSENQILNIHDFAFENLKIHTLKLNDIGKLNLYSNSLDKLSLIVLSIKNSRLSVLDFSIFMKIDINRFQSLYLTNNNFRNIDRQFETIISRLKDIDFYGNPLICNCSVLWLKRLSTSLESSKITFPKCVSPDTFRSKTLSEIDESEFKCEPPKISEIKVNFINYLTAELFCKADPKSAKAGKIFVSWMSNSSSNRKVVKSSEKIVSILINKSKVHDNIFKCIAENTVGQTTIVVSLDWPSKWNIIRSNFSIPIDYSQPLDNYSWANSFYFKKRYTLVELIVAVVSTFITTILLFLIVYKICTQNSGCFGFSDKPYISHQKLMSHQKGFCNGYPPFRFNTTENGLHTAESNSQTYDCISINNALYPHQMTNTLPGPFIDYKTHERVYSSNIVIE